MCKIVSEKKHTWRVYFSCKLCKKTHCFLGKNLHCWHKFYTTAGRDKFHLCIESLSSIFSDKTKSLTDNKNFLQDQIFLLFVNILFLSSRPNFLTKIFTLSDIDSATVRGWSNLQILRYLCKPLSTNMTMPDNPSYPVYRVAKTPSARFIIGWKFSGYFAIQNIQIICKVSGWTGKFPDNLKSVRII